MIRVGSLRWVVLATAALPSLISGCHDDLHAASFVEPVYADPCQFTDCSGHGKCAAGKSDAPSCLCEPGYQGDDCQNCEQGFHRDAHARCMPDKTCAQQPSNPCGDNGDCTDADGVIACNCHEGYAGPRCTLCADGYAHDASNRCLPEFFVINGSSEMMSCAPGYTGATCTSCAEGFHLGSDVCLPDQACVTGSCPANANCAVAAGVVQCTCLPGYTGLNCFSCAPGFHTQDDACVADEVCASGSCPSNATCRVVEGRVQCPCDPGYADDATATAPDCSACAAGYHADADGCVPDQTCAQNPCPATAACAVVGGVAACTCLPGYTGANCESCDTGFHQAQSGTCVLDEYCDSNSCPEHATCSIVEGQVSCACNPGWSPEGTCDLCQTYATERSGFEFPTGWPSVDNTCLSKVELAVSLITFTSRLGPNGPNADVLLCAPSTFSQMTSQHIELFSYASEPATMTFEQPAHLVAFDYGSRVEPLQLEIRAHDYPATDLSQNGRVVGMLSLDPDQRDSITLVLEPAARVISFWSKQATQQHVAIDDVIYSYPECN